MPLPPPPGKKIPDNIETKFYKKKNSEIVVEALKLDENNVDAIANWAQAQIVTETDALTHTASEGLNVQTLKGKRRCSRGQYVIKHGENFYVFGGKAFETQYDLLP